MMRAKKDTENNLKVDLEWDDNHVFPPVINPDLEYLYKRMNEATIEHMNVVGGENTLDIGCGRAIDVIKLAVQGGKCIGLEPSKSMINLAKESIIDSGAEVCLVQGIGEYLPFKTDSLDRIMCKGALDHFVSPDRTIEEMARVLKPEGKVIIMLANFESLGFKLGRTYHRMKYFILRKRSEERQVWEIPHDHNTKFDYALLKRLADCYLKIERSIGISLLLGSPGWALLLTKLPKRVSKAILVMMDKLACHIPSLSDVVLLECVLKQEFRVQPSILGGK